MSCRLRIVKRDVGAVQGARGEAPGGVGMGQAGIEGLGRVDEVDVGKAVGYTG